MNSDAGYAVFFFPPALEVLGDAIKPYLQGGPSGPHVPCREVDTAGAFIEMTLSGRTPDGREMELELMVPGNMVRMIVSTRSDGVFGFHDRHRPVMLEPGMTPVPSLVAGTTPETAAPAEAAITTSPGADDQAATPKPAAESPVQPVT